MLRQSRQRFCASTASLCCIATSSCSQEPGRARWNHPLHLHPSPNGNSSACRERWWSRTSHRVCVNGLSDRECWQQWWVLLWCFFSEPPLLKPEQFIEVTSPFLCAVKINDGQKPELYASWITSDWANVQDEHLSCGFLLFLTVADWLNEVSNSGLSAEGWKLKPSAQKSASPPMTSQIREYQHDGRRTSSCASVLHIMMFGSIKMDPYGQKQWNNNQDSAILKIIVMQDFGYVSTVNNSENLNNKHKVTNIDNVLLAWIYFCYSSCIQAD